MVMELDIVRTLQRSFVQTACFVQQLGSIVREARRAGRKRVTDAVTTAAGVRTVQRSAGLQVPRQADARQPAQRTGRAPGESFCCHSCIHQCIHIRMHVKQLIHCGS